MQASVARNDDTCLPLMFGMKPPGELVAGQLVDCVPPMRSAAIAPIDNSHRRARDLDVRDSHSDWETVVTRLLDWADEAKLRGRARRADYLVCLAWEAYERLHP